MKTIFPIAALLLSIFQCALAQDIINPEWVLRKASPVVNGNAEAWAVGTDAAGNVLWGVNQDMPGLFQFNDALVYKLDPASNLIWTDTAATGPFAQQSYYLTVTDSTVFLGGRTCSSINVNLCDALLFTTNTATGTTGWKFTHDRSGGYEEIDGISLQPDGIVLTGWSAGNGTEVDGLLMKIDYGGNVIWEKPFAPSQRDDHFDGHLVADDSMVYVCGLYNGSPLLGWDGRAHLAKFNLQTGEFVDSIIFGRQDTWVNAENALGMTSDGTHLYVTGYTTPSLNNWDIFLAKFDKNLHLLWYKTWGGPMIESSRAIAVATDGSIFLGGNTNGFGAGDIDVVLLKFKPNGSLAWYKTWGGSQEDQTLDIHLRGNILYLTGKTSSFHAAGKSEALLMKIPIDTTDPTADVKDRKPSVVVQPNPATQMVTVKLSGMESQAVVLTVHDQLGRVVLMRELEAGQEILTLDKSDGLQRGGIYLVTAIAGGRRVTESLMMSE